MPHARVPSRHCLELGPPNPLRLPALFARSGIEGLEGERFGDRCHLLAPRTNGRMLLLRGQSLPQSRVAAPQAPASSAATLSGRSEAAADRARCLCIASSSRLCIASPASSTRSRASTPSPPPRPPPRHRLERHRGRRTAPRPRPPSSLPSPADAGLRHAWAVKKVVLFGPARQGKWPDGPCLGRQPGTVD